MADNHGGAMLEQAGFAQTLATLKQEGSNVLLVGAETADAHGELCHRLLGDSADESRYRLFVTDGGAYRSSADHGRSGTDHDLDGPSIRTIDHTGLEITASGAEELSDRTPLGTLGIEIIETIDEFEADAGGLEPAQLRMCVDSLTPLLEDHSAEKVFRLLHMVTSRVGHVQGMGHYHLPLGRDHDAVRLFEPLFDAIVEIRARDGGFEQRWQFRDRETATDWIPF